MPDKKYSAGLLQRPKPDDECFDEYEEAEDAARQASIDDSVWAVFDNETGSVEVIAYQRIIYS